MPFLVAVLLSTAPSPFDSGVSGQVPGKFPPELVAGIPIDWGSFPDYFTVLATPRLETGLGEAGEYRVVSFPVEVKKMLPVGKHFMARFYNVDGMEVKWSVLAFEPSPDTEVPGRCVVSIWWVPDAAAVAQVKILLE
jgi:hypothetical protein